jgi:ERCC4-related helicase
MNKSQFLKEQLVPTIAAISPEFKPIWGKMNLQQMTEHMSREGFQVANGKLLQELVTPAEQVEKMQAFLMSDKPFRENTPNSLMSAEPLPVKHPDMNAALAELQTEIDDFFKVYENEPGKSIMNPFFGALNFELQVQLLHKHATHHLRQFGVAL